MNTQWTPVGEAPATRTASATRIAWILSGVTGLVGLVVGLPFGFPWLLIPGALIGWVTARHIRNSAFDRAISHFVVREATEATEARVLNVIDGLCMVSGDRRPRVHVMSSSFPAALAVAGPGAESWIVVSDGFVATMDRIETEAVMAHLLWRIRSGSAECVTYLLALQSFLARCGLASLTRRLQGRISDESILDWADLAACQTTRYPPALVSALEKCQRAVGTEPVPLAPLWFAIPEDGGDAGAESVFSSLGLVHSSLDERITILKEI